MAAERVTKFAVKSTLRLCRCIFVDKCDSIFVELSPHNEWAGYHYRR